MDILIIIISCYFGVTGLLPGSIISAVILQPSNGTSGGLGVWGLISIACGCILHTILLASILLSCQLLLYITITIMVFGMIIGGFILLMML